MRIVRFAYTPFETFGRLYMPTFSCVTVEPPWRGNQPFVSCIPPAPMQDWREYPLKPTRFRNKYATLEVCGVPKRSEIKVHVANTASQLQGCIALGNRLGTVGGEWAVLNSQLTFERWWEAYQAHGGTSLLIVNDLAGGI
jgi:hypothetical protein